MFCIISLWFINVTDGTLYGPLHSQHGIDAYLGAIEDAKKVGGKIAYGGKVRIVNVHIIIPYRLHSI